MAYILYSLCFVLFVTTSVLYFTRNVWIPRLPYSISDFSFSSALSNRSIPFSNYFYTPLQNQSSFEDDMENGLSSDAFDLRANVSGGDSRSGLDDDAKREIRQFMKGSWIRGPVDFDEARRMYMERMLERQGIGRDGLPRDPKFVSFS